MKFNKAAFATVALASVLAAVGTISAQAQTLSVLYSFTNTDGDGSQPLAGLLRDTKGKLYGTTEGGGINGNGTVFKVDSSGNETVLYSFMGPTTGGPGADGSNVEAGLVVDKAGNLFGTTGNGGVSGLGTVFKLDSLGNETVLYRFTGPATGGQGADGAFPVAALVMDKAGNLYGTTANGGVSGFGTVFKLDTFGNETVLHSFAGPDTGGPGSDGAIPRSRLVIDNKGNLYGTTLYGGPSGYGTVFKVDSSGNETLLHSFTNSGGDGAVPFEGLLMDKVGNLYGTTTRGGSFDLGTVFKLDRSGNETVLYRFSGPQTGGPNADGASPFAGLLMDTKGNLYGTTNYGGASGFGIVFKLDISGKERVLHSFTGPITGGPGAEGAYPWWAGLVMDSKGKLYGTTFGGGVFGQGTVFTLVP
jgi:uncharacterized repeat protein (TIGR03803 family)